MAWWREARFGMFVHWGLYSGLAGTWKGKKVGDRGGIDWHHPQYDYVAAGPLPHPLKKKPSSNGPRNHAVYVDFLHRQAEELMTGYGGVDVIWWDYSKKGSEGPFWRADELMAMVRKHQPAIISNNRLYHITSPKDSSHADRLKAWDPKHGDFTTPEQHIPATGVAGVDWEVCMTMNTTWGRCGSFPAAVFPQRSPSRGRSRPRAEGIRCRSAQREWQGRWGWGQRRDGY